MVLKSGANWPVSGVLAARCHRTRIRIGQRDLLVLALHHLGFDRTEPSDLRGRGQSGSCGYVAIDGSKFKAINARDKNFTEAKMKRRLERIDESIARYMTQLETADRRGDAVP